MSPRLCPTPSKTSHGSLRAAEKAARNWCRRMNERGELFLPLYAYRCGCGAWHSTHLAVWNDEPQILLYAPPAELQRWAFPEDAR